MNEDIYTIGNNPFITFWFLFNYKVPKQTIYNNTSLKSSNDLHIITHPARLKLDYYFIRCRGTCTKTCNKINIDL